MLRKRICQNSTAKLRRKKEIPETEQKHAGSYSSYEIHAAAAQYKPLEATHCYRNTSVFFFFIYRKTSFTVISTVICT
jgi:hypothetical protein